MSLIRQVWLLLIVALSLAFAGGFGISVYSARQYLDAQLRFKNQDGAQSLALTLGQQKGDRAAMETAIASQFDTGHYASIQLLTPDGATLVERKAGDSQNTKAPGWFVSLVGIHPPVGVAQVSDGWKQVGRLEVASQTSFAHDELWEGSVASALMFLLLAGAAGAIGAYGVGRIRRPLLQTVEQAQAITERRFVAVSEPTAPELRNVTRAMNVMVARVRTMFDEQATQVEQLRRQAHCDPLTGLSHRQHFMARLKVALDSEDGSASGALVLVRMVDLQALNRRIGRGAADALIKSAAAAMVESAQRYGAGDVGRLNGSDFALLLPDVGSLREPAVDVVARLRSLLIEHEAVSYAVAGAVRWWHGAPMSSLLAAADQALARAEGRGAYSVEIDDTGDGLVLGEDTWRQRIAGALTERRVELASFPLVDRNGDVVHLECPLRLRIGADGQAVAAVQWLPMARRANLTGQVDALAIELALTAIARDKMPRSVNVSPASLLDTTFTPRVREILQANVAAAPGLWLEVAESGAMRHLHLMRALAAQMHAFGGRIGIEHAGEELAQGAAGLLEAGLDFAKLDASLSHGIAADPVRATHVGGMVRMLHGIGFKVYAEGISETADAAALWNCGIDGVTGPAVKA
jgi:EAL domain-containing protein (putative c-di-GMP-specific phosphodiesterase class I)/GGDEF domain-containing protein